MNAFELWCWRRLFFFFFFYFIILYWFCHAWGEGDNRGWVGWMATLTRLTWVWVNSGSWWWTGRPGVLQFMESQRVGHDLSDWSELKETLDEGEKWKWKSCLKTQHSKQLFHGIWSHHFMANMWGKCGSCDIFYLLGLQNHCGWWLQQWNEKTLASWKKSYDKSR